MHMVSELPIERLPTHRIAAAFDCLARLPSEARLDTETFGRVAHLSRCRDHEVIPLVLRLRAAAFLFGDPRWLPWSAHFKSCGPAGRAALDSVILQLIAALPLDDRFRFDADHFFAALGRCAKSATT